MNFYVTGGSLQYNAPSYMERKADQDLLQGLLEGEFCYVLTARQMGKSSLMVRAANRLRAAGVQVAALDLTAIGGQNVSLDQWYHGLLDMLGQELDLEEELEVFWQANSEFGPLHRLLKALRQVILPRLETANSPREVPTRGEPNPASDLDPADVSPIRLVIFVDEIDLVRSLPFSTDEFFAALRRCYNQRSMDSAYKRLTFCLLGVASPSDLIQDTRTTPFNIGRRIELNDFNPEEAAELAKGLEVPKSKIQSSKFTDQRWDGAGHGECVPTAEVQGSTVQARRLLERILYWTEGHPYLTQKLCRVTAEALQSGDQASAQSELSVAAFVDRTCEELFFSHRARERDDNLVFVRERLLRNETDRASLLHLYLKVWQGKRVKDDELDPLITLLRLSGVVRSVDGGVRERNRIYARAFDAEWVHANMPQAELQRQREAYRRGAIWAASVSSIIIFALLLLSIVAVMKTVKANVAQARAWRSSGKMGQRIEALDALQKANWWGFLFGDRSALRNEAIAALNLVDLRSDRIIEASAGDATPPELGGMFSRFAVADRNGKIQIMSVADREIQWELPAKDLPVRWLRFGFRDEYLGVGYGWLGHGDQRFVLYRLTDKSQVTERAEAIARNGWDISPKGDWVAVGSSFNDIRLYSLPGGELLSESVPDDVRSDSRSLACLRSDPLGKRLAIYSRRSLFMHVWNIEERKSERYPYPDGVVDLDWHPSGHQLATACENGDIYLLDLRSKIKERLYRASMNLTPSHVCFNHMGTVLATVCSDVSLRLWGPQNRGQMLVSFDLAKRTSLRFSADDQWLSLSAEEGPVRLLKVEGGRELATFHGDPSTSEPFQSIGFDPQGRVLIAASPRAGIRFWDIQNQRSFGQVDGLAGLISTVQFDCNRGALLASTARGIFQIPVRYTHGSDEQELNIQSPQCLAIRAGLGRFDLSTNGSMAVIHAGQTEDHIDFFQVDDPDHSSRWAADRKLETIAITPDGQWLFGYTTPDQEIFVWDLSGKAGQKPCQRFPRSRCLNLSPSGKWLITEWAGEFVLRRVGSGSKFPLSIRQSQKLERFVPVAFVPISAGGECLLAVATSPTMVELFRFADLNSPKIEKLAELESPDHLPVVCLAFDPTGGRLAAAGADQIVQVWDLAHIRDELHERGLASGLPNFPPLSSGNLHLVFVPSKVNEQDKAAAHLEEEWSTRVANLTEQIEMAELAGEERLFTYLLGRADLYRSLRRHERALRDLNQALKLRPSDPSAIRLKEAVELELELKRGRPKMERGVLEAQKNLRPG